jgi:acetyltransferase-like isoleucine patch superfamily enzyme
MKTINTMEIQSQEQWVLYRLEKFYSDTSNFDKEVKIGSNVWIGMNSLVLKGAVIGDNTIIAAGSTVTGEIPANCIAAGNPAIPIKYFTPQ